MDPSYDASYINALREAAGTTWDEERDGNSGNSDDDSSGHEDSGEEEGSVDFNPLTATATSVDRLSNSQGSSNRCRRNRCPRVLIGVGAGPLCGLLAKVIANCLARNCRVKVSPSFLNPQSEFSLVHTYVFFFLFAHLLEPMWISFPYHPFRSLKVLLGRGSERFLAFASRADPLGWAALEVACSRSRTHKGRSRAKVHLQPCELRVCLRQCHYVVYNCM